MAVVRFSDQSLDALFHGLVFDDAGSFLPMQSAAVFIVFGLLVEDVFDFEEVDLE